MHNISLYTLTATKKPLDFCWIFHVRSCFILWYLYLTASPRPWRKVPDPLQGDQQNQYYNIVHVARLNSYFCSINIVHVHDLHLYLENGTGSPGTLRMRARIRDLCIPMGSPLLNHSKSRFCSCMKMVIFCVHRVADPTRCGRLFSIGTLLLIAAYHVPLATGQQGK